MNFPTLIPGTFIKRGNRFVADVRLDKGGLARAFVPTTGRLTGALQPGCRVWLEPVQDAKRKTPYNLTLTELAHGGLCSVNAYLANRLFEEAVRLKRMRAFPYEAIDREVPYGRSRLDFRLFNHGQSCWVEVKSVTYAAEGVGRFPDAPTERGRKHLGELAKLAASGDRASVVFVAQREDAARFAPFEAVDPEFSAVLRENHHKGVEVHAYRCAVSTQKIEIVEEIPVDLKRQPASEKFLG